jgi:hypothetical protein
MDDLIEALQIFRKYTDCDYPVHCMQGTMLIMEVDEVEVSQSDMYRLETLGFYWSEHEDCFVSYKFGSA